MDWFMKLSEQKYYHGTSTSVGNLSEILPSSETEYLQEKGRKKNLNKVFVTKDLGSAWIYAGRAVQQFAGQPVVYVVDPMNLKPIHEMAGTSVYMADKAVVLEEIKR